MSHLYQDATCLTHSITLVSIQKTISSSTIPPVFKVPLDIPSFSSIPSPIDPGGSKKEIFLKSSNLSKTSTRSKGSSRRFQRHSFHLKRTPYEKFIAFCSMRSTCKIGKKRCHVAPMTGWHMTSVLYKHDDVAPLTGWHMEFVLYKPDDVVTLTGWHVASVQYRQMTWQLYGHVGGSPIQSRCDMCNVQTMRWQSSQQYGPIQMQHMSVWRWLRNLVGSTTDELAADWALRWTNLELPRGSTGLANIDWSSPKCCCSTGFKLLTSHTLSPCLYQLHW